MLASLFLTLREGMEAALIVGILLGSLKTFDFPRGKQAIWLGVGTALLGSLLTGYLLNRLGANFQGRAEEIFEGTAMILAAGVLTWVILWMRKQAQHHNQKLEGEVKAAARQENRFALFSIAFLAIIREGVELAFFLTAVSVDAEGSGVLAGAALGLVAAILLAVLLYRRLIRLNIGRFFQVTSLILILFAAGLVAHGVHEFNEVGLIPPVIEHLWDINPILDENSTLGQLLKALLGYNGNPSLTEVLAYGMYFVIIRVFGFRFREVLVTRRKVEEVPV
jgi:high-affinity iron transporter